MASLLEIEEKMQATLDIIERVRSFNEGADLTVLDAIEAKSLEARLQQLEQQRRECCDETESGSFLLE